jgi:hypothetical protein
MGPESADHEEPGPGPLPTAPPHPLEACLRGSAMQQDVLRGALLSCPSAISERTLVENCLRTLINAPPARALCPHHRSSARQQVRRARSRRLLHFVEGKGAPTAAHCLPSLLSLVARFARPATRTLQLQCITAHTVCCVCCERECALGAASSCENTPPTLCGGKTAEPPSCATDTHG